MRIGAAVCLTAWAFLGRPASAQDLPVVTLTFPGPAGQTIPDCSIAAGPASLIVATNSTIALYRRDGTLVTALSPGQFFRSNFYSGDPKIVFDRLSGRFFASAVARGTTEKSILLAVSRTSSPASFAADQWFL